MPSNGITKRNVSASNAKNELTDGFPLFLLGVLGGVIVPSGFIAYSGIHVEDLAVKSISSSDQATLYAGFGGAVMGGVTSWLLAWQTERRSESRERVRQLELERAAALSLFLKIQAVSNGYFTHRGYMWSGLNEANNHGLLHGEMWKKIRPQAGATDDVSSVTSNEFVPLVEAKRADLINDCQLLFARYRSIAASLDIYSRKREALQENMKPFTKLSGKRKGEVITVLPKDQAHVFELAAFELESLIRDIYSHVIEDFETSKNLCEELSVVFKAYFKETEFVTMSANEAAPETQATAEEPCPVSSCTRARWSA
ncbi:MULTISPECIES: hypothetical protein [Rhizobium]|uniref:hypothetical protein n=2 Tax=Rhizobium/Agrobacterium group TaxID=227290 RepID=UPI000A8B2411|nr:MULTISPECIES: hypothetical protein [Rhizobium]MCS0463534.1 hypothetical protein [Rhizobium favelukesii]UFS84183.1 hypothetical protein LPB79_18715 [Rhizobium sp. T136]